MRRRNHRPPAGTLRYGAVALSIGAALAGLPTLAAVAVPPRPAGSVYDGARVVSAPDAAALETLSRELWEKGKVALVVATLKDLGGSPLEEVTRTISREWGIGGKENRGVLLLAAIGDRRLRIEAGYGVEGYLTDGTCGEIIDEEVLPRFRAGDVSGGLRAGAERIAALSAREFGFQITGLRPASRAGRRSGSPTLGLIVAALFALVFFFRALALGRGNLMTGLLLLLAARSSRGYRRGGGFGSGGFSSGGFGGGGFGGFGGGSFGGGGASRGW
ncbi:MAG: TPM domain-containing protein [Acidobacteria bacterium]|nr:TPM domain-containing protein [Acidobacteriota bacterium]